MIAITTNLAPSFANCLALILWATRAAIRFEQRRGKASVYSNPKSASLPFAVVRARHQNSASGRFVFNMIVHVGAERRKSPPGNQVVLRKCDTFLAHPPSGKAESGMVVGSRIARKVFVTHATASSCFAPNAGWSVSVFESFGLGGHMLASLSALSMPPIRKEQSLARPLCVETEQVDCSTLHADSNRGRVGSQFFFLHAGVANKSMLCMCMRRAVLPPMPPKPKRPIGAWSK